MSHDLVVFGEDWGAHPSSTQHLIRQFLPDRRVIWVNSIGLRSPKPGLKDGMRVLRKLGDLARSALTRDTPQSSNGPRPDAIIAPAAIPLPGNAAAASVTRHLVSRQVQREMDRLGVRKPVLWTSLPTAEPMIGAFGERAVVYYAGDDFGALEGVDHTPVLELEEKLAGRADLILAASPDIAARFPEGKTMVVPHGVDVGLFSGMTVLPSDMPLNGPIIGFYGSISGWVDIPLIIQAARAMPEARFVLIGPVNSDPGPLERQPNVMLLGPKAHRQLPAYVQHFDVAMLPFRDTPQIRACNPLKLREYLASGTPVASTDFPALDPYRSLIHVGHDAPSFIEALRNALADKARADLRRRAVAGETWVRRAEDVAAVLDLI